MIKRRIQLASAKRGQKSGNVTDLSKKLKYALDDPGDLGAFKPRITKKLSMEYNWDPIFDKYVELYQQVVRKSRK